jgi:hypothetical protein
MTGFWVDDERLFRFAVVLFVMGAAYGAVLLGLTHLYAAEDGQCIKDYVDAGCWDNLNCSGMNWMRCHFATFFTFILVTVFMMTFVIELGCSL